MLLVVSTLFFAYGGIPAFNRLLLQAAMAFCQARRAPLYVWALTDPLSSPAPSAALSASAPPGPVHADPLSPGSAIESPIAQAAAELEPPFLPSFVRYQPCGGDRHRLIAGVLGELGRPLPLVIGHVNLAPLGLIWPVPYGVIAHGSEVYTRLPLLRRLGLLRAARIACVSDHTRDCVQRLQGVAAKRCLRVVNALPVLPALPAPRPPLGPLRLLCISRLHPDEPKGIDALLQALCLLPPHLATLTVIGDGPARPALLAFSAALRLDGRRVRFLGAVPDAVRDAELDACDVFVLPSEAEGFGIVYLEALARGKPCIAAQAGGAPEIVRDGETGFLVPTPVRAHIPALAAAIASLADPALRARLGQAGRQRVEAAHTQAAFTARAQAFFAALSSRSHGPIAPDEFLFMNHCLHLGLLGRISAREGDSRQCPKPLQRRDARSRP